MKCKICKTLMVEEYDNYPFWKCLDCEREEHTWDKFMSDYIHRWKEDTLWDKPKEKAVCIVGYFCHRYQESYDIPFAFSIKSPDPFKSNDWIQVNRLLSVFHKDARKVKSYMDWYFFHEIPKKKRKIKSVGGLNTQWLINDYNQMIESSKKIGRTSKLPTDFVSWCHECAADIFNAQRLDTYEDLNFLISYCAKATVPKTSVEFKVRNEAVKRNIAPITGKVRFED